MQVKFPSMYKNWPPNLIYMVTFSFGKILNLGAKVTCYFPWGTKDSMGQMGLELADKCANSSRYLCNAWVFDITPKVLFLHILSMILVKTLDSILFSLCFTGYIVYNCVQCLQKKVFYKTFSQILAV